MLSLYERSWDWDERYPRQTIRVDGRAVTLCSLAEMFANGPEPAEVAGMAAALREKLSDESLSRGDRVYIEGLLDFLER